MRATSGISLAAAVLFVLCANSSFAQEAKALSSADLAVQTSKWEGRLVEATFRCFYADKDEFRCIAGRARVDFSEIVPAEARAELENKCDTIEGAARRPECSVKVRFTYEGSDIQQSGISSLTVVSAKDGKGEIIPTAKKKRR